MPSSTTPTLQTSASFLRHDVTSSLWLHCAHNHTHSTCTPDSIKINRIERGRLEWTLLIPSTAIQFVHAFSRVRNDSCLNLSEGFVLYNAVSKTGSREEICQSFNERCFCSSFSSGNEKMGPWGSTNMTVPFQSSLLFHLSFSSFLVFPSAKLAAVTYEGNGHVWSVLYILVYRLFVYIALIKLIHKTVIPFLTRLLRFQKRHCFSSSANHFTGL